MVDELNKMIDNKPGDDSEDVGGNVEFWKFRGKIVGGSSVWLEQQKQKTPIG